MLVRTRVASNKSPWLSKCDINDEHLIAISHGEGRFVCNEQLLNQLIDNGQIATSTLTCFAARRWTCATIRTAPCWQSRASRARITACLYGKDGHSERSGRAAL